MNLPVRLCDFSDVLSNENGSRARQMPFSVFSQQSLLGYSSVRTRQPFRGWH